jgi:hypothetical protein
MSRERVFSLSIAYINFSFYRLMMMKLTSRFHLLAMVLMVKLGTIVAVVDYTIAACFHAGDQQVLIHRSESKILGERMLIFSLHENEAAQPKPVLHFHEIVFPKLSEIVRLLVYPLAALLSLVHYLFSPTMILRYLVFLPVLSLGEHPYHFFCQYELW